MVKFIVGMTPSMSTMNKAIRNTALLVCYSIFPSIFHGMNLTILKFGLEIFLSEMSVSSFCRSEILTVNGHVVILEMQ